jgi:hypothetical protein
MEEVYSLEILAFAYQITNRCRNSDQHKRKLYDRKSLKCYKYIYFWEFGFAAVKAEELHRESSAIALSGTVHDTFSYNKRQRDAQFLKVI